MNGDNAVLLFYNKSISYKKYVDTQLLSIPIYVAINRQVFPHSC